MTKSTDKDMFMPPLNARDIELLAQKSGFDGYFSVQTFSLKHRLYAGGWSPPISREVFVTGDAVVVLPYDPVHDRVVLIEQFRAGAFAHTPESGSPWLVETVAGRIDKDETAEQVARREAEEEAGCALQQLHRIGTFYQSPGATSEQIHYFCGIVDSSQAGGIHGLASEHEDIRVFTCTRTAALAALADGRVSNVTLAFVLQWLSLNHEQLRAGAV